MSKRYSIIVIVVGILLVFGIGYFVGFYVQQDIFSKKISEIRPLRYNDSKYSFIDPLLLYIVPSADQQWGLGEMKNQVLQVINSEEKNGDLSDASVIFQDLNLGRWIGVNQNDQYNPASMLKVIIMVSYFKEAEQNPSILSENLLYTSSIDATVNQDAFNDHSALVVNQKYSVQDLIEKMIIDSDNGAASLLLAHISATSLNSVYNALDIPSPDDTTGTFTISPRYYSFFFRILYSATYLTDVYSEKALGILSQATFKDGLVAGVPQHIPVAHKYGEYIVHQNDQVNQIELHDCGIVYYPKNPYLLCVMTRGSNLDTLKNTIKNISWAVYQSYSALKP